MSNLLDNQEDFNSKASKKANPQSLIGKGMLFIGVLVTLGGLQSDGWITGLLIILGGLMFIKKSN